MSNTWLRTALVLVLAHAAVNLPHSAAHIAEAIWLPLAGNIFVVLVILLAPFVALGLLYTRRHQAGALLLCAAMLGALLFGIAFHFVLPGPDNVAEVPLGPWRNPFLVTSVLLALLEAAGAALGGWMLVMAGRSVPSS